MENGAKISGGTKLINFRQAFVMNNRAKLVVDLN